MDIPVSVDEILRAENFLGHGDIDAALPALLEMRDAIEDYVAVACITTDDVQYFCFASAFERLAYRRIEQDPRELVQVEVPFDRVYAALAFAYIQQQEYALARDALKQAVRWNPMGCAYRLDLAELYRVLGDEREWGALNFSVLDRAADAALLGRAYAGLGQFFLNQHEGLLAAGFARRAVTYAPHDARTHRLMARVTSEAPDAANASEEETTKALEEQGFPTTPNAEIAICLLMCATDASRAGDRDEATRLTVRARDLVGEDAAKALIQLIHESDAELAAERARATAGDAAQHGAAQDGVSHDRAPQGSQDRFGEGSDAEDAYAKS